MSVAASRLGLHRSNLYRKMRQLGMEIPRVEREDPVDY
jgi:transcriptional regulator of acetoin/glycerol metabolism